MSSHEDMLLTACGDRYAKNDVALRALFIDKYCHWDVADCVFVKPSYALLRTPTTHPLRLALSINAFVKFAPVKSAPVNVVSDTFAPTNTAPIRVALV